MESIIIIIAGLIFSVISKSVKDKQEIEKERKKRKDQLSQGQYNTSSVPERTHRPERKQKSLKDIFMEELDKVGDEDGNLGDIFRKSLREEPQKVVQEEKTEDISYMDDRYISEEEYTNNLEARNEAYMNASAINEDAMGQSEIIPGQSKVKSEIIKKSEIGKTRDNQEYNPFTKSLNRKDIIRGVIFSEVLDKPKSMRNERRSM